MKDFKNLQQSIYKVMMESRGIYENHDEVIHKLHSAVGNTVGSETTHFTHGKGKNTDFHDHTSHSSPVKDHYYHQGEGGDGDHHEHHITVSHHEDGSATVHHTAIRRKWSEKHGDYNESHKTKENHFKSLHDAAEHLKKSKFEA